MDQGELHALTAFACALADAARAETLPRLGRASAADKNHGRGGFDPVTEADRAAETAMRAMIEARFPDHGIAGEEFGTKAARSEWVWSLDPIDGTRAYICGLPSWTTLIALLLDEEPVVGVIDSPQLGERFVGWAGQAELVAKGEKVPLLVSGCGSLAEARLSTTDPYLFESADAEGFGRVRRQVRVTRYGLDAFGYAKLAAGDIDLVIESGLKPHDYKALIPVVRGAGGVIGNWRGEDDFAEGKVVAAASVRLFDEAVRLLSA